MMVDGGREDLERLEEMDGAPDARRDRAGEGGAGRVDVKESRVRGALSAELS